MLRSFVSILCAMFLAGCGVQRTLTVDSDPQGALVYLNNQELGRTPMTRDFTWYGDYEVQLRREGCETIRTHRKIIAPIWQWVPLDLPAELLPFRPRDQRTLFFSMKPASTQPADTAVMLDRAADMREQLQSSRSTRKPSAQPIVAPTTRRAR